MIHILNFQIQYNKAKEQLRDLEKKEVNERILSKKVSKRNLMIESIKGETEHRDALIKYGGIDNRSIARMCTSDIMIDPLLSDWNKNEEEISQLKSQNEDDNTHEQLKMRVGSMVWYKDGTKNKYSIFEFSELISAEIMSIEERGDGKVTYRIKYNNCIRGATYIESQSHGLESSSLLLQTFEDAMKNKRQVCSPKKNSFSGISLFNPKIAEVTENSNSPLDTGSLDDLMQSTVDASAQRTNGVRRILGTSRKNRSIISSMGGLQTKNKKIKSVSPSGGKNTSTIIYDYDNDPLSA
jgi:hypothetical protein